MYFCKRLILKRIRTIKKAIIYAHHGWFPDKKLRDFIFMIQYRTKDKNKRNPNQVFTWFSDGNHPEHHQYSNNEYGCGEQCFHYFLLTMQGDFLCHCPQDTPLSVVGRKGFADLSYRLFVVLFFSYIAEVLAITSSWCVRWSYQNGFISELILLLKKIN